MTYATDSILARCTAQCRIASPLGTLLLARTDDRPRRRLVRRRRSTIPPRSPRPSATTIRC